MTALFVWTPEEAEVAMLFRQFIMFFHDAFEVFAPNTLVQIEAVRHLQCDFGNGPEDAQ
ncbi:hypothetical protein D3C85_1095420 [compost metagenome]